MPIRLVACCVFALWFVTASARAANYDGTWEVDGVTEVGPCEKTFHGEVSVEHNDIVGTNTGTTEAVGSIEANGTAWARFTRADGIARAQGHFQGASASGAWSSSTAYCGGRWKARKVH
jgi:hypothetical protein